MNGTIRQRLASLTRKCRHAARRLVRLESGMWPASLYLQSVLTPSPIEPTGDFCSTGRGEVLLTLAMANGLTDHIWSVQELLSYRVAPLPWVEPTRRGRPRKHAPLEARSQALPGGQPRFRPLLRLRKGVLYLTTS